MLRLPLEAADSVAHRGTRNAAWAPTVAFDAFVASAQTIAGAVLRDELLAADGRRAQARVDALRREIELCALAAQHRQEAEDEFRRRYYEDEYFRLEVEERVTARVEAIAREARERRRHVEEVQRSERERASRQTRRDAKLADEQARAAQALRSVVERSVLRRERDAVDAAKATDLDDEFEDRRQSRRSG